MYTTKKPILYMYTTKKAHFLHVHYKKSKFFICTLQKRPIFYMYITKKHFFYMYTTKKNPFLLVSPISLHISHRFFVRVFDGRMDFEEKDRTGDCYKNKYHNGHIGH